jgi:hypothetical protein
MKKEVKGQTLTGTVDVDDVRFTECVFNGVQLRYGGGELPEFIRCDFDSVSWYFTDAALRTIQLLQVNGSEEGGRAMIDQLFAPGYFISA